MTYETLQLLRKELPDALCEECNGNGEIEQALDSDLDSITAPVICLSCEGSGVEYGYENEVKEFLKNQP